MKALVIEGAGGPEVLHVREVPRPEAGPGEVLVRVRAAGVNRADLMQAKGEYPAPAGSPGEIPGLEYAGEVAEVGPGEVDGLVVGDRVFGIVGGGGQAEYVVVAARTAVKIPANLDFEAAGAVPESFITAHDAIEARGLVRPGERVLIHAVGGGVGSAAVQVAHAMGCIVFGTSRTAEKLRRMEEAGLGVDHPIVTSEEDFTEAVGRITGGEGVHAVVDFLGASAIAGNLAALAIGGRLVVVGLLGGGKAEVDLRTLMAKRISVVGTTLRSRPIEGKILATRAFAERVVPWRERGLVRPLVDRVYPIEEVGEAHRRVASNEGFGKVVLRV